LIILSKNIYYMKNMKEYTIKLTLIIESQDADYEKISEFAEKLSDSIVDNDELLDEEGVEIISTSFDIVDHNDYSKDDEDFLDEEDYDY